MQWETATPLGFPVCMRQNDCRLKKLLLLWAKFLHCVRTACILRTQRLGYSPKNTCHLFSSTAKQQSPHENNKTAFTLVIKCRYKQANQPYKVQLCKGMQDAHMFKWQVPHSDISPGR